MGQLSLNIFTFPLWWYTSGSAAVWDWYTRKLHFALVKSGIVLFARHMREPLYGDYSRSGVMFSFFLRIILILGKSVLLSVKTIIFSLLLALYFLLLPAVIVMVLYQIVPS